MKLSVGERLVLGQLRQTRQGKQIYAACLDCGKERWVQTIKGEPRNLRCVQCVLRQRNKSVAFRELRSKKRRGSNNPRWIGGKIKSFHDYIHIRLQPDDPFYCMANQGYVPEHRLIIAKELGRPLLPYEQVHHIDSVRHNNARNNLMLLTQADHSIYNKLCSGCELRKEIRLLRWQVKQLINQSQGVLL